MDDRADPVLAAQALDEGLVGHVADDERCIEDSIGVAALECVEHHDVAPGTS